MSHRFLDALRSGRVLLMDGAMGTELQKLGLQPGECGELWNITHPERVRAVHQAYVDAGAEVLLTNTFQANADSLRRAGLQTQHEAVCRANELACVAAGNRAHVLQDSGPVVEKGSEVEVPSLRHYCIRAADSETDGILLETFSTPRVRFVARKAGDRPVLLSLTYLRDTIGAIRTRSGHNPEWFAKRAELWGAVALGVNCGRHITMSNSAEIIRRYREHTDLPLFARPNAGTPTKVGDEWIYPRTPEQMAAELPELLEAGVSMVGGCCGTTPAHIAAFRKVIDEWNARRAD